MYLNQMDLTLKNRAMNKKVSTRADNHAQSLYKKVLGAKNEATIKNLFSVDGVYMVVRNV